MISPPADLQDRVMEAIYDVKAGRIMEGRKIIVSVANHLAERGSDVIICGCTEVSLVLRSGDVSIPIIDPLQILSEEAVATALGRTTFI